ncbi:MAG: TIR domain-containing protein [Pleurocapsa minor GSE-CHR-MK-17-07R]|nr:TIR domain-containing protein [Pleurocapsa minor GSE-CHR-MK 17-07R]
MAGKGRRSSKIFISYKSADRPIVEQIASLLRRLYSEQGVWFDKELIGGQKWWNEIVRQIASRDTFIYLISREAIESIYCRMELTEAWLRGKHIVPLKIRNAVVPPVIASSFQTIEISDFQPSAKDIVEIIASIFEPSSQDAAPPTSIWKSRNVKPIEHNCLRINMEVSSHIEPTHINRSVCNTGIFLIRGDEISIHASGRITIDSGQTFMQPDGRYLDLPPDVVQYFQHPEAFSVKGHPAFPNQSIGVIGSLFGWIGDEGPDNGFFIGLNHRQIVHSSGFLHLAINDSKGAYADNSGVFEVTVDLRHPQE